MDGKIYIASAALRWWGTLSRPWPSANDLFTWVQIIGHERFLFFNLEAYPYVLDTPSLIQSLIDEHRAPEVVQIGRTALLESALDEPAPWGTL